MSKKILTPCDGFTLLEMAIVMVIFGLLIGGIMGPLKMQRDNMKRQETQQSMTTIKQAIMGFALSNGRLPCPDVSNPRNGQENRTSGNCVNARGNVPWATLGVNGVDGWKRFFSYQVDTQFADTTDGTGCPDIDVVGISFEICSAGDITVLDNNGGNIIASNVPVIIVSHGKNWATGDHPGELENNSNNRIFVDRNPINESYDDLVDWISINSLTAKMVSANKLP